MTSTALIPTTCVMLPHAKRWDLLGKLTASDLTEREQGLNYVIRNAAQDPRVAQGAIRRLDVSDQINFLHIVNALDRAGLWQRPTVPMGPWLRWLSILSSDPSAEARILGLQITADLTDEASDERIVAMIRKGLMDHEPDVRYNALVAAGELHGVADDPTRYESIILSATGDAVPTIAHHAWLMVGLLDPANGISVNWRDQPPQVAQAILWAAMRTNPDQPAPAIEAITDPDAPPTVRAMAAYSLHMSDHPDAQEALINEITNLAASADETNQLIVWRAILAVGFARDQPDSPAIRAVTGIIELRRRRALTNLFMTLTQDTVAGDDSPDHLWLRPLYLSAYHRLPTVEREDLRQLLEGRLATLAAQPLIGLAILEGLPVDRYRLSIPDEMGDMLRLTASAAKLDPTPEDLRLLLASSRSTMRDLACVVAADRLSPEQNRQLIRSLLTDYNDDAKCSGAILAGLTGLETKLLAKKTVDEDIWKVRQIMSLGLWMQDQPAPGQVDMARLAPGLLTRHDVPWSTVLLAMLHRRQPAAWQYLLNPRGEEKTSLIELLDQARWWRVLARYLPPDAPVFWYWADPELEQFQIDVLREWYLLHQHRWPPR